MEKLLQSTHGLTSGNCGTVITLYWLAVRGTIIPYFSQPIVQTQLEFFKQKVMPDFCQLQWVQIFCSHIHLFCSTVNPYLFLVLFSGNGYFNVFEIENSLYFFNFSNTTYIQNLKFSSSNSECEVCTPYFVHSEIQNRTK